MVASNVNLYEIKITILMLDILNFLLTIKWDYSKIYLFIPSEKVR